MCRVRGFRPPPGRKVWSHSTSPRQVLKSWSACLRMSRTSCPKSSTTGFAHKCCQSHFLRMSHTICEFQAPRGLMSSRLSNHRGAGEHNEHNYAHCSFSSFSRGKMPKSSTQPPHHRGEERALFNHSCARSASQPQDLQL